MKKVLSLARIDDRKSVKMFISAHNLVAMNTIKKAACVIENARSLTMQWAATIHYLRAAHIVTHTQRTLPLVEAPTTSNCSVYLACSGYYREAISMLRVLTDLVLWEWIVRCTPLQSDKALLFQDFKDIRVGFREEDIESYLGFQKLRHFEHI